MTQDRPRPLPVLTDVLEPGSDDATPSIDTLALQEDLNARALELSQRLVADAAREIEILLYERVLERLRAELPDLIDETLRTHLAPVRED